MKVQQTSKKAGLTEVSMATKKKARRKTGGRKKKTAKRKRGAGARVIRVP
jgi:hypothetical protein